MVGSRSKDSWTQRKGRDPFLEIICQVNCRTEGCGQSGTRVSDALQLLEVSRSRMETPQGDPLILG